MDNIKNSEVLIDGKIYSLSGTEDQQYLQKVAGYISEKTAQLKRQEGFTKQSQEYQAVMVEMNIADDYFKALDRAAVSDQKRDSMERDSYSLKHELVTTQMNLERKEQELAQTREQSARELAQVKEQAAQELAQAREQAAQELAQAKEQAAREREEAAGREEALQKKLNEAQSEILKLKALQAAYSQIPGNQPPYRQNGGYNQNYNNNRRG